MKNSIFRFLLIVVVGTQLTACKSLRVTSKTENTHVPSNYVQPSTDSTNSATTNWKQFFTDPYLVALIDTALVNNQELNITLQEIQIAQNEVRARKGEYLPTLNAGLGGGLDKSARYTMKGTAEENLPIVEEKKNPFAIPDFGIGLTASWEIDIWKKLRNAKNSAFNRYLSSVDGRNFLVTNLIAEIANSYYELLALDNQLQIVRQNMELQSNALKVVKQEKEATRVTELAVKKFEAEVFHTQSLQYAIQQQIVETENRINYLVGRYPQSVARSTNVFLDMTPTAILSGVPSQLLENRMDIKQAEHQLAASKLDVKVAKAKFYPSLAIRAGVGFQSFNFKYFIRTPQSLLFNVAGDLIAPLLNRNAIKAEYYSANSKQIQAVYKYEQTILNAYVEVLNQVSNVSNLNESYQLQLKQVTALNESVAISTKLFQSAKADYMEVLMTQRDALESKFELIETKINQMHATVNLYKALGGGWR